LLDPRRATLGLGIVRGIDVAAGVIHVDTPVPAAEIATIVMGREPAPV
jgi:polynucleotide 5'-kinase involved in rRNA processing